MRSTFFKLTGIAFAAAALFAGEPYLAAQEQSGTDGYGEDISDGTGDSPSDETFFEERQEENGEVVTQKLEKINMIGSKITSDENEGIDPLRIIGSDNRKIVTDVCKKPENCICQIQIFDLDDTGTAYLIGNGSGTLIGDNVVITATHVLYPNHQYRSKIAARVCPGKSKTGIPYEEIDVEAIVYYKQFFEYDNNYDICLLYLDEPIAEDGKHLELNENASISSVLKHYGYPMTNVNNMIVTQGFVNRKFESLLYTDIDAERGQSGGPLLDEKDRVIAVLSHESEDQSSNVFVQVDSINNIKAAFEEEETTFRIDNPNSGEHMLTNSGSEYNVLKKAGWKGEGSAWITCSQGDPVYRLYNPNAGDHHFTVSLSEAETLTRNGWKNEGIVFYVSKTQTSQIHKPVYRVYNPNAKCGAHHFTTSKEERDFLVKSEWKGEGIAWYVYE